MRRAGTQGCQRRVGWDQLCDAVPRGVLQSKRQSGWKQFDIERATDRLLLSRLVSPRWPQDHPLRAAQLQSCARLTSNIVVADYGLASLRARVLAWAAASATKRPARNGHHRSKRLVAWLTAPVADSLHSTITRQRA